MPQAAHRAELSLMNGPIEEAAAPAPRHNHRRKVLTHLAKAAFGVGIVAYLLTRYDIAEVSRQLGTADPLQFLLAWVYAVAALFCFALMTRIGMRPLGMTLTTGQIFKIQFQLKFYSLFMPGASNLLVKWYKFARPAKQPAQALIIMGLTRLVHTISLLLLTSIGIWNDALFPWPTLQWVALASAVAFSGGLAFMVSEPGRRTATWLAEVAWVHRYAPAIFASRWRKLWHILSQLQGLSLGEITLLMTLAIGGNFLATLQHLAIGQAVGLDLSVWVYAWLRGIILIAAIIPVSVSGLGIREVGVVGVLIFYAVPEELALAYSLLYFGGFVLGNGVIGGILELFDTVRGASRPAPPPTQGN